MLTVGEGKVFAEIQKEGEAKVTLLGSRPDDIHSHFRQLV